MCVKDRQVWEQGLRHLSEQFASLAPAIKLQLTGLLAVYKREKESLAALVTSVDSETICRDCGGQCCLNGKYRVNVFDVMALFASELQITANFEQKPLCPYGTCQGCRMEAGFRPADCVLFVCDTLDRRLSEAEKSFMNASEIAIRGCILKASLLMGEALDMPLLLWSEKLNETQNTQ
jgi:hypothetical protein